jgi:hypothetical protein
MAILAKGIALIKAMKKMEIRLKIWELWIVASGLIASGVFLGLVLVDKVSTMPGLLYFAGMLFPTLSIILRNRYQLAPKR